MLYLGRYDKNHTIYVSEQPPFRFDILRNDGSLIEDPSILEHFLNAYDVSIDASIHSGEHIQQHISKINQDFSCDIERLKRVGLIHLEESRPHSEYQYISHIDELEAEFLAMLPEFNLNSEDNNYPILEFTKKLFQKVYYTEHVKDTVTSTLIVMSQQGFLSVHQLIEALLALNIPADNIILTTKPHTTNPNNTTKFEALQRRTGIHYVCKARAYRSAIAAYDQGLTTIKPSYTEFKEAGSEATKILLEHQLLEKGLKKLIIHDEGGELIQCLDIDKLDSNQVKISTSEHTSCGIKARLANEKLSTTPCFNMAGSILKTKLEAYFIAEASFNKVKQIIDTKLSTHPADLKIKLAIVGAGGNIGEQFLKLLISHYPNQLEIMISENNSDRYRALQEQPDLSSFANRASADVFAEADIVCGCTGQDITEGIDIGSIVRDKELKLISLSSGTREFKSWLSCLSQNPHIHIENEGKPIIFDGSDHAIHPLKIQTIRALTMSTIMLQLMYLAIEPKLTASSQQINHDIHANFHKKHKVLKLIDAHIQYFILKMYKHMHQQLNTSDSMLHIDLVDKVLQQLNQDLLAPSLEMKHEDVEQFNAVASVDALHTIHLLKNTEGFQLYLSKYGEKIYDYDMIKQAFADAGVNMTNFLKMPAYLKLEILKNSFSEFQLDKHFLAEQIRMTV